MKKLAVSFLFALAFIVPSLGTQVYAQFNPLEKTCESGQITEGGKEICDVAADPVDPTSGDDSLIIKTANILALVAGVVAVVIIVIAGINMMLSGGDSAKVTSSRNTIIYTAVGLFVVLLSRTIVVFIIDRLIK